MSLRHFGGYRSTNLQKDKSIWNAPKSSSFRPHLAKLNSLKASPGSFSCDFCASFLGVGTHFGVGFKGTHKKNEAIFGESQFSGKPIASLRGARVNSSGRVGQTCA